ncbi:MAG: serine--tRNA ligase [Pseudomonadota bacterium]
MFDIKWIRDNPEAFDAGLKRRGGEPKAAALIALDDARRENLTKLQEAQARRNAASKEIGKARGQKDEETAQKLMAEVAELKAFLQAGEDAERENDTKLRDALASIPNLPLDDVPQGEDENDNVEVKRWGEPKTYEFEPKQHFEIGEALGLMDFETAAKLSGARFVILEGQLARLERAIATFMLDQHTGEGGNGYTEYQVPLLVKDGAAFGTAQLPKFSEDLFRTADETALYAKLRTQVRNAMEMAYAATEFIGIEAAKKTLEFDIEFELGSDPDRFWLIPTAEVSLTNMVRDAIQPADKLPMRCTAWTPCFRSEAGSAGRDTRGMIRQHQFSKVELVSITTEDQAIEEHERMTRCAEGILEKLELPYRTMLLCTGDMGFGARKTYDLEVWLPGQDAYREISSCSVCGDFQARRMNARYRAGEKETRFVHTLNGSGLAVGRTLVAILENYQQADGTVAIPVALQPYMGGQSVLGAD